MEQATRGMKKRTIEHNINQKIDQWLTTVKIGETEEQQKTFRDQAKRSVIVTGGAITSMLLGQMPNDYDVYFSDISVVCAIADYYLKALVKSDKVSTVKAQPTEDGHGVLIMIKSAGVAFSENQQFSDYQYFEYSDPNVVSQYFNKINYEPKADSFSTMMISSNAISLSDQVQLITRFVGPVEYIHQNFDFAHCTNYWTAEKGVVFNTEALEYTLSKQLVYQGTKFPICSLFRLRKFIERGWTITAGEIFKIAYDVSKLDLEDRKVLAEQLIGVDQAYFGEILSIINQQKDKPLDRTYLFELVSRVFD